jgi:mannose-6-phosphate isomerase
MDPTVVSLDNPIQTYAWGSRTALAEFLGRDNASHGPEAELWIGAHPKAPSRVVDVASVPTLGAFIEGSPDAMLGPGVSRRFSRELPFLLKVIAAAEPLSIQCHPNREQARTGFERENRANVPLDAFERNYRDPNHKPELVVALSPFVALKGFRPFAEILDALRPLGLSEVREPLGAFEKTPSAETLKGLFAALLSLDEASRIRAVGRGIEAAARQAGSEAARLAIRLHDKYPGDVGALSPFFLNLIALAPEEGLFLDAGELHAHIGGTAIEIMAPSDNVLRGGLTSKHIDVPELLKVGTFAPTLPRILRPTQLAPGERVYETPAAEFQMALIDVTEAGFQSRSDRGPELLLGLEGSAAIVADGQSHSLGRGRSVFVPAAVSTYRLEGNGRICRAGVPSVSPF